MRGPGVPPLAISLPRSRKGGQRAHGQRTHLLPDGIEHLRPPPVLDPLVELADVPDVAPCVSALGEEGGAHRFELGERGRETSIVAGHLTQTESKRKDNGNTDPSLRLQDILQVTPSEELPVAVCRRSSELGHELYGAIEVERVRREVREGKEDEAEESVGVEVGQTRDGSGPPVGR